MKYTLSIKQNKEETKTKDTMKAGPLWVLSNVDQLEKNFVKILDNYLTDSLAEYSDDLRILMTFNSNNDK